MAELCDYVCNWAEIYNTGSNEEPSLYVTELNNVMLSGLDNLFQDESELEADLVKVDVADETNRNSTNSTIDPMLNCAFTGLDLESFLSQDSTASGSVLDSLETSVSDEPLESGISHEPLMPVITNVYSNVSDINSGTFSQHNLLPAPQVISASLDQQEIDMGIGSTDFGFPGVDRTLPYPVDAQVFAWNVASAHQAPQEDGKKGKGKGKKVQRRPKTLVERREATTREKKRMGDIREELKRLMELIEVEDKGRKEHLCRLDKLVLTCRYIRFLEQKCDESGIDVAACPDVDWEEVVRDLDRNRIDVKQK